MRKFLNLKDITEIISRINNSGDTLSLLNSIIDITREALDCEGCSLLLYDPNEENLKFFIARGAKSTSLISLEVPKGRGIAGYVLESKKAVIVNDAENDPRIYREIDREVDYITKKLMASPMITRNETVGVLEAVNPINNEDFSNDDLDILCFLSEIASTAIYNRQLFESQNSRIKEINGLYLISKQLTEADSLEEFVKISGTCIAEILEIESLSFFIKKDDNSNWQHVFNLGLSIPEESYLEQIDKSIEIKNLMKTGKPIQLNVDNFEVGFHESKSQHNKTNTLIPVYFQDEMRGILSVKDKKNEKEIEKHDLKLLMIFVNHITEMYRAMIAKEEREKLDQIRRDLLLAGKIQKYSLVEVPEVLQGMKLAMSYYSCKEIGGDFYDIVHHSSTLLSFVIADVSGKGIPAALFMEFSKTILSTELSRNIGPGLSLKVSHQTLQNKFNPSMHVEVMVVQVDTLRKKFRYASAGHNRQIYYNSRKDKIEVLRAKGIPLGSKINFYDFETKEINFSNDDFIVLYTDGITECMNDKKDMFGEERLIHLIYKNKSESPEFIKNQIETHINEHRGDLDLNDDYTIFIIKF